MAKKKEVVKKFHRPLLLTIIASYFLLQAFGAILDIATSALFLFPNLYHAIYPFIQFLYYPGIPFDLFTQAVVSSIPFYSDFFIYIKFMFILVMFLLAGYTLLRMKKIGFYLGLFITLFGLIAGTTYGFKYNPIEYLQNIFGRFSADTTGNIVGIIFIINFLLFLIIPIYLILNRRLFTK